MNQSFTKCILAVVLLFSCLASSFAQNVELEHISTFHTGIFDEGAAEIVAFDAESQRLFFTNADNNAVTILDISDPANPTEINNIDLDAFGNGVNSVSVFDGLVAVAVEADPVTAPGEVVFFDIDGNFLNSFTVGALPDMLRFTPDGQKVVVANEGEPDEGIDPEGSISIIDLSDGVANATVTTADFTAFNGGVPAGVRIFPNVASIAQDLEPEYITVSEDSQTAFATLQEANAIAVIDIASSTVVDILPLGLKNHSLAGNGLDASDDDGVINITNWPVFGMYMPDAITSFSIGGETYLVTANEGDDRGEDDRIKDLDLDPVAFPNAGDLQEDENLGRLGVSTINGDTDGDGDYDELWSYGARSFSIWSEEGALIYDSGDDFEQITAAAFPDNFNASNDENDAEGRSDNKGPEPEAVEIGKIGNTIYAFIGLERIGGIMMYDVTDPKNPEFVQYLNNRDFDEDVETPEAGDLGVEEILFIDAKDTPNCEYLLVTANEVSGTVSIFSVLDRIALTSNPIEELSPSPVISVAGGLPPYATTFETEGAISVTPLSDEGSYMVSTRGNACIASDWTLTIKDANGCEVVVSNSHLLKITEVTVTNISSSSNGSIDITVSGGSGNYSYEWSNEDTTEDIIVNSAGSYSVIVTDDDTGESISCSYSVSKIRSRGRGRRGKTALTTATDQYGLWTVPNPAQDFSQIHFSLPSNEKVSISLYSIEGKEILNVFEGEVEKETSSQLSLNTTDLAEGMYILQLQTATGTTFHHKLLITK